MATPKNVQLGYLADDPEPIPQKKNNLSDVTPHDIPGVLALILVLGSLAVLALRAETSESVLATTSSSLFKVPIDFRVYYEAGKALNEGRGIYAGNLIGNLPFTYPPFAGALFSIVATIPILPAAILWQILSFGSLVAVIIAVLSERGYRLNATTGLVSILLSVAFFLSTPVRSTIYFGQINLILMLLVSVDFLRHGKAGSGIGTGLAAGIKLTPAVFGLLFLIQRRWIAAATSAMVFIITFLIGQYMVPDARSFWVRALWDSSRVGVQENPGAQSLRGALLRVFGIDGGLWWLLAVAVTLTLTIVGAAGAISAHNRSLAMSIVGIGSALISPFSWHHHWVWLAPMAVCILDIGLTTTVRISDRISQSHQQQFAGQFAQWGLRQIGAALSVAVVVAILLPYIETVVYFPWSYFNQAASESRLWRGIFVWQGCAILATFAIWSIIRFRMQSTAKHRRRRTG